MPAEKSSAHMIDEYIAGFPQDVQKRLKKIRGTIRETVPEAEETINYGIPTFKLKGNLVHFAGYKNHVGFYPASSGITQFKDDLSSYPTAKGSVQFPHDRPIPYALITQIVRFRVQENLAADERKRKKKNTRSKGQQA